MTDYVERLKAKQLKHLVVDGSGRVPIDYADEIKKASYYVGSWLLAKRPVSIYSRPNGPVVATIPTGNNVGRIVTWVTTPSDGALWWQLEGSGAGNGTGGFVKHEIGAFDSKVALGTGSGAEHAQTMAGIQETINSDPLTKVGNVLGDVGTGIGDAVSGVGKTLSGLGKYLPLILLVLAALVIAGVVFKFKTIV